MKKFLKTLLWIVLIGIIAVGGYFGYLYFKPTQERGAFNLIPEDAVFIIETQNLSNGWQTVSDSKMWQHLISNPFFSDVNEGVASLDKILKGNKAIDMILRDRQLIISSHMVSGTDYDFLFVVDMQKASNAAPLIKETLEHIEGYKTTINDFNDEDIIELLNKENSKDKIYLSIVDNLLLVGFKLNLIERAITQKNDKHWDTNTQFVEANDLIKGNKLFSFYFNYSQINKFSRCFIDEEDEMIVSIANTLGYSAFNLNLEDERLYFDGYTNVDSLPSYIRALANVKPGKIRAYEIISDQAALYVALCFNSFDEFYKGLEAEFSDENAEDYETYSKRVKQVEKIFKIDIHNDFFNWIGTEISFVKLRPSANARVEDAVMIMHANDIEDAKKGLTNITNQIPLKFDIIKYKNYEINYLNTKKGLMMLLFGKLFEKLEKPYFTYIEDFVVFSNSMSTLQEIIDDYINGKTLSRKEEFENFKDEFKPKTNVSVFIQMPKLYTNIYHFTNRENQKSIKENKDLILSFARVGFQLVSEDGVFKNTLIADHDQEALFTDNLEVIENNASNALFVNEFDSLTFKVIPPEEALLEKGEYTLNFPDNTVKFEGHIENKALTGLGRSYYESGNLKSTVNYDNGMIEGIAYFYYDIEKQTRRIELSFEEDVIQGIYREFYENGARKVMLNYEDAKIEGNAEFYYESGTLKIEGKYKDNAKSGKWKYYNENGEIISIEKWKKGNKKKEAN